MKDVFFHTALPTALVLVRTLCDDHSRSSFTHSWELVGKVVQLGLLVGLLFHKHDKLYHELIHVGFPY